MKTTYLLLTTLLAMPLAKGQGLSIGVPTPHSSAVVELSSSNRGLLAPRLTTAQRIAVANPAEGLLVYDTDLNLLMHFTGTLWAPVGGSVGTFSLPFAQTLNSPANAAFTIGVAGASQAMMASAAGSFSKAIEGTADGGLSSYGLFGQATNSTGIGIAGISTDATAVYGFSSNGGTALRGTATNGSLALQTSGYIRLTGGNTNPVAGSVLTSIDNNGNAVWKKPKSDMAFELAGAYSSFLIISHNTFQKVHFNQEPFDYGNDCAPTTSSSPTPGMSSFVVPTTGIYEFDIAVALRAGANQPITSQVVQLMVNRSGNLFAAFTLEGNSMHPGIETEYRAQGGAQCRLQAGDIVYVTVKQTNTTSGTVVLLSNTDLTFFNGHLVFAE